MFAKYLKTALTRLVQIDKKISYQCSLSLQRGYKIFSFFAHSGDFILITSIILAVLIIGLHYNQILVQIANTSLIIVVVQALAALCIKKMIKRKRPSYLNSTIFYNPIPADRYSFPSAHAMRLSGITMVLFLYNVNLGLAFLIFTGIVCLARIVVGTHYLSDIVGGIFFGGIFFYLSSFLMKTIGL